MTRHVKCWKVSRDQFSHYRFWMAQTARMQVNVKPILSAIDQNSSRVTPTPLHLRSVFWRKENTPRNPNINFRNSGNFWLVIYVNILETWPQLWDLTPESSDQVQAWSILRAALPSVRENSGSSSSQSWFALTRLILLPLQNSLRWASSSDVTHWRLVTWQV